MLAAFINAATLIVIAIWIGIEAIHRLSAPVAVQPRLMMTVAAAGVVMNGVIAALLWGVARDVNLRSAFLHMAGDTLSTAAVIAGGAGILFTGQNWIDPVLSLMIAALILWSSIGIVRETLNILLEGTPRGVSLTEIRAGMEAVEGVLNVHDLHVWSLGSQSSAMACHVTIADIPPSESACILVKLNHVLREHFHISHTTMQFEHMGCEELAGCVVPHRRDGRQRQPIATTGTRTRQSPGGCCLGSTCRRVGLSLVLLYLLDMELKRGRKRRRRRRCRRRNSRRWPANTPTRLSPTRR